MIQIKQILGLDIKYDTEREKFYLYDSGMEIGSAETQAAAEKKAKTHIKQAFVRVDIFSFSSSGLSGILSI